MKNKRLIIILFIAALLLLIPLIAMQFSEEVKWTLGDFLAAGALLLVAGLSFEFVLRKVTLTRSRILLCAAIILILALVWAELAVGIFDT